MDIDDLGADAFVGKRFSGFDRFINHKARCDYRHVAALTQGDDLAELEFIALVKDSGHCKPAESHINGAFVFGGGENCRSGLNIVGGVDYDHTGDNTHERDILAALVARAVLTDGDARMGSSDLDVKVRIRDGVPDLLIGSARREHCEGACEYGVARGSETRGNAHHVALSYARVKESVGVRFLKHTRLGSRSKVGVQNNYLIIYPAKLDERFAVSVTGRSFNNISHFNAFLSYASSSARAALSSLMACSYCSALGAVPCQPT